MNKEEIENKACSESLAVSTPDPDLDTLYRHYEALVASAKPAEVEANFVAMIDGANKTMKTKQFTAQYLPLFIKNYPQHAQNAIAALITQCESDDVMTRVHAIKGLAQICVELPENASKIAYLIGQMLNTDSALEANHVHLSLTRLLQLDPKAILSTLFTLMFPQTKEGEEPLMDADNLRAKICEFLHQTLPKLAPGLLHPKPDLEEFLVGQIRAAMPNLDEAEFKMMWTILLALKRYQNGERADELMTMLLDQAGLDASFKVAVLPGCVWGTARPGQGDDMELCARLSACVKLALPYMRAGSSPTRLVGFYLAQILPQYDHVPAAQKLVLLKTLAEMATYTSADDARSLMGPVYAAMLAPGALHAVCGIKINTGQPSDLLGADFAAKLADFQKRLSYLERNVVAYLDFLKQHPLSPEQHQVAWATSSNILTMARALLQPAHHFINSEGPQLTLSWHKAFPPIPAAAPAPATAVPATAATAPAPQAAPSGLKEKRSPTKPIRAPRAGKQARPTYVPPALRDAAAAAAAATTATAPAPAPQAAAPTAAPVTAVEPAMATPAPATASSGPARIQFTLATPAPAPASAPAAPAVQPASRPAAQRKARQQQAQRAAPGVARPAQALFNPRQVLRVQQQPQQQQQQQQPRRQRVRQGQPAQGQQAMVVPGPGGQQLLIIPQGAATQFVGQPQPQQQAGAGRQRRRRGAQPQQTFLLL
ncbi:putative Apoptosis inhibitory 5 [Paratrimastix pyriformis]|uniref:Apoptosis inhibitory 5 n=1 Tax=Paratrimastix pyriformis TaxID=342808 RepID=A0ABQ8UMG6_9EUKA|nr:putative Apoptosis inhibitory 5 [Paratrimastix pyriformis]